MNDRESTFDESRLINDASREENSPALLPNTRQELVEDESSPDVGSPTKMARDPLKGPRRSTPLSAMRSTRQDALRNCGRPRQGWTQI